MKCITISCFNNYTSSIKNVNSVFTQNGYEVLYLYGDLNHLNKSYTDVQYPCGERIHVPKYKKNLSPARLWSHFRFSKKVKKRIYDVSPDVIFCIIPPNTLVKDIYKYKKKNPNLKLIYFCYDLWPGRFISNKSPKLLKLPLDYWNNLRKKYIKAADLLLTLSEVGRERIQPEAPNTPFKLLKPALEAAFISDFAWENDSISFCYIGNINHILDIDLCVQLLTKISASKKTTVHIIGEGVNFDDFVSRLKSAGINVCSHGCIFDREGKNKVFSKCNFGLSLPKQEIRSSMALKTIEYMCVGLPFINSGVGATSKFIETHNVGINVNLDNLDETAKAILDCSPKEMKEMHNNCISLYEQEFVGQDLREILSEFLVKK